MTVEELSALANFGDKAIEMIKQARGLSGEHDTNLLDPEAVEAAIFGDEDFDVPMEADTDDGLEELVLVLRLPPRRVDWLNRLSRWGGELNPGKEHLFTVEALVISMINDARRRDDTNAGASTSLSTYRTT